MAPMNGTIKRLVSDKGFGFILASDGNEYFFHNSACNRDPLRRPAEGQAVTFERGPRPEGPARRERSTLLTFARSAHTRIRDGVLFR